MASSYCEISFTWKTTGLPATVTTYSFIETATNDAADDDINSYDFHQKNEIHLVKDEETEQPVDNCVLHLSCPNPEFACVNGISIISESRTLEISNDTDGYIATVRGRQVSKLKDESEQDESSVPVLYLCKCLLEGNYSNLNVKFLSLGERTTFCLHSLVINISQCTENKSQPRGTFDMNKLKKDVSKMGDAVSDRAKDFLATMEQFEENKLKSFGGLMGSLHSNDQQQPSSPSSQGLSSIMKNILGAGTMASLLGESSSTNEVSSGAEPDMYKMLQAVCGGVTSMRAASAQKEANMNAAAASPDSGKESLSRSHSRDAEGEEYNQVYQLEMLTAVIDQKISQAKSDLQTEFLDFKREITLKLDETTSQMNEKLDRILSMLGELQCRRDEPQPKNKTYQDYL